MPAKSCSSITPDRLRPLSTDRPVKSVRPRSSSPSSARPVTPSPRLPGRRSCPTGWARTPAVLLFSAARRRSWCPIICAVASPRRIATSPTSTPVIVTWPSTMAWPSCPLARANPRTKPRSKLACKWSSAGSWQCCATASSSRSENSTRQSACCWIASIKSPSRSCPAHAAQRSRPSTSRHCKRCRNTLTSTPNGKKYASTLTTTSRSMAITTRCRTSW
ncbi:hypothetical protein PS639_05913 [Pseudomonas fluorescens]|nr:hypothetical protein PS639_01970 [Pseudomonas fluorescens]VVM94272.1 hypothetical protein PS639_02940 [Pseudomonas fluorescens]VVN42168.1 hypothetical protein PS639_05433 [Pseudomonas fluorescens]VVN47623.1 hypothetical protein PS639_05913 [Pseudomonas fluorescens]